MKVTLNLFSTAVLSTIFIPFANATESALETLVKDGKTNVDFRYRYEGVEQEGIDNNATANTLRTRLTFQSGTINNFSFKLEMDDSRPVSSETYNSGTNGNTDYPVVADPKGTDLNQAYLKYQNGGFSALGGRQRILLDDQRFVGGVGWRQNEQTYDGLNMGYKKAGFNGSYSYINNVNRIFGPTGPAADWRGNVHLVNGAYSFNDAHKVVGFIYSMDFDNAASNSNDTYGLRYLGDFGFAKLTASYASQSDAGDNPITYTADYMLADLSGKINGAVDWNIGYEVLGSDEGSKGFITPLATLHKWQGWADKFLGTPNTGIKDVYVGIGGKVGPLKLKLAYHDFSSDFGSNSLGSEIDAVAIYPVNNKVKAVLKLADYSADTHATDTQKIWFMVQVSL